MSKRLVKVFGDECRFFNPICLDVFQFSPDGSCVFFSTTKGLYACDLATGFSKLIKEFQTSHNVLSLTPDCQVMYVQDGGCLERRHLQTTESKTCAVSTCGCLATNGKFVAVTHKGTLDCRIFVSDEHLKLVFVLRLTPDNTIPVTCLHMSSDFLASAADDKTACVWQLADGKLLQTIHLNCQVASMCIKNTLLAVSYYHSIELFSVDTGNSLRMLYGHYFPITGLAFSPDGRFLASSSVDRSVRVWNLQQTDKYHLYLQHARSVNAVAFSLDGKQVVSCDSSFNLQLWTVCDWSDRNHHLFGHFFKALVFQLMCIKQRLDDCEKPEKPILPKLPMAVWLDIFGCLFLMHDD